MLLKLLGVIFLISALQAQASEEKIVYLTGALNPLPEEACTMEITSKYRNMKFSTYWGRGQSWSENLRADAKSGAEVLGQIPAYSLIQVSEFGEPYASVTVKKINSLNKAIEGTTTVGTEGYFYSRSMEDLNEFVFQFKSNGDLKDHWARFQMPDENVVVYNCFGVEFFQTEVFNFDDSEEKTTVLISSDEFFQEEHLILPKALKGLEDNSLDSHAIAPGPRSISGFKISQNYFNDSLSEFQEILNDYATSDAIQKTQRYLSRNVLGRSKGLCAKHVRLGYMNSGLIPSHPGIAYAKNYQPYFENNKWTDLLKPQTHQEQSDVVRNNLFKATPGCAVVYDALNPRKDRNGYIGHIETRIDYGKKDGFISDYYSRNPRTGLVCLRKGGKVRKVRTFTARSSSPFHQAGRVSEVIMVTECLEYGSAGALTGDEWNNRKVIGVHCKLD